MEKIKIDTGAAFLYPMPMVLVGSVVKEEMNATQLNQPGASLQIIVAPEPSFGQPVNLKIKEVPDGFVVH